MKKKHYIVTFEDELFLSYAENPKKAIWQIIEQFEYDRELFKEFKARSVGSIVAEYGNVAKFKVVEVEE